MQVAFFCRFRQGVAGDVPGFGSGRPGFGKTLCKKTSGCFFAPYVCLRLKIGLVFLLTGPPAHPDIGFGLPPIVYQ